MKVGMRRQRWAEGKYQPGAARPRDRALPAGRAPFYSSFSPYANVLPLAP
jgi:hypothetical protein